MELFRKVFCIFVAVLLVKNVSYSCATPSAAASYTLRNCTKQQLLDFPIVSVINELIAQYCSISVLENAYFIRFSSLTVLEISNSQLVRLEDYALHGLKHLRVLSLAHNNISVVKSWSNEQMSALNSLDLRRNSIYELTLQSFRRYPNLQRLNLAMNLLESIDEGVFRWMPHLKHLNLERNRLRRIEARYFHGMHRLTHLSLNYNEIEFIAPTAFQTNSHLRFLKLEGNHLVNLEFMMAHKLIRLVHLNLSHNEIESLEEMSFNKDYELADLDLSYNRLTEISVHTFAQLESLEQLNISHNSVDTIEPRSFHELTNLQHIDLSANNLTQLPAQLFHGSTLLQRINLARNSLGSVDAALFAGLPYLNALNLSANQLRADAFIENLAAELNRAELTLDLSDNHFNMLNMSALMDFERVELAGNWWSCHWLIHEMLRIPQTIHFGRNRSVVTAWSNALLDVTGIDCYDVEHKRSIVVLDTGHAWEHIQTARPCGTTNLVKANSPTAAVLPKLSTEKFESRWVIIWMLIGIAMAFSALRIARKLIDRKACREAAQRREKKLTAPHFMDQQKHKCVFEADISDKEEKLDRKSLELKMKNVERRK